MTRAASPDTIADVEAHAADIDPALVEADVAASFEERVRAEEADRLSALATLSYPPERAVAEPPCRLRYGGARPPLTPPRGASPHPRGPPGGRPPPLVVRGRCMLTVLLHVHHELGPVGRIG